MSEPDHLRLRRDGIFRPWVDPDLYIATVSLRLYGIVPMLNHCVLVRIPESAAGAAHLLVWNPVELTPQLLSSLRQVERETGLEVRHLFSALDWHHLALPSWQAEFPHATLSVVSERIPAKQPSLKAVVLDDQTPNLNGVSDVLDLLPVEGCLGPRLDFGKKWRGGKRCELFTYHRPTRTLLVGDMFFFADSPALRLLLRQPSGVAFNKIGFRVRDRAAVWRFVEHALARPIDRLLTVHGTAIINDERQLKDRLRGALCNTIGGPPHCISQRWVGLLRGAV